MSPEMIKFFFDIVFKNELFELTEGYPWRPVTRNYIKKTTLHWQPMEIGGVPPKDDDSSP